MIKIIDKSFGIELNDLLSITAKVFGFNRVGAKITDSMKIAYDELIEKQRIRNIDKKIIINNDER